MRTTTTFNPDHPDIEVPVAKAPPAATAYRRSAPAAQGLGYGADILGIASRYTKMTKAGKHYKGCCPLPDHKDKTPSFFVFEETKSWHCQGCHRSGGFLRLVELVEGVDEETARIKVFGERRTPRGEPDQKGGGGAKGGGRDLGLAFLDEMADHYVNSLVSERGQASLEYLVERGLTPETIARFDLGYCTGYEHKRIGGSEKQQAILESAGILKRNEYGVRDWMQGRLVFPIKDSQGRVIGFSGRSLAPSPKDDTEQGGRGAKARTPKYLNTPTTDYFKKSDVLFGLAEALAGVRREGFAILVEGFFDTCALHQHGVDNTMSAMGTALGENSARTLWNQTDHLVLCMDGDAGGAKGTRHAILAAGAQMQDGQKISVICLPAGDPDELVHAQGKEAFLALCRNAMSASSYLVREALERFPVGTAEGRAGLRTEILSLKGAFPSAPIFADELERELEMVIAAAVARQALAGVGLTAAEARMALAHVTVLAERAGDAAAPRRAFSPA